MLAKRAGGIEKAFSHPEFNDASRLQTVIQPEDARLQERNDISVVHVISDFPCMSWGSLLSETWSGSLRWPRKIRRRKKGLNRTEIYFLGCFCVLFSLLFVCFQTYTVLFLAFHAKVRQQWEWEETSLLSILSRGNILPLHSLPVFS